MAKKRTPIDYRALRNKKGLSQAVFWSAIGVTQSGGSRYETGRTPPLPVRALVVMHYIDGIDVVPTVQRARSRG